MSVREIWIKKCVGIYTVCSFTATWMR